MSNMQNEVKLLNTLYSAGDDFESSVWFVLGHFNHEANKKAELEKAFEEAYPAEVFVW